MISKAGSLVLVLLCSTAYRAAAQSAPDEPFAVISRGRPAPHVERRVVVLRDTLPARGTRPDSARPVAGARADTARATAARTPPAGVSGASGSTGGSGASTARPPARPPVSPPAAATAREGASGRTHRVEWGDTWYGIAQEYGVTSTALRTANPDVDPERLVSGALLRIPTAGNASARRSHRVAPGESLWGIARRYGVSTESIRKANGLDGDRVRIGETLVIPGGE